MITSAELKVGMRVKRGTHSWVEANRLGIKERMTGTVLTNPEQIGVRVLFDNEVDTYCWGDDLDAVIPDN